MDDGGPRARGRGTGARGAPGPREGTGDDMTDTMIADLAPPRAFDQACHMVVDYLAEALPLGAWAVTRVTGERQTILVSDDHGFGLAPGVEGQWTMTICRTMVSGETPRVVPDTGSESALCDVIAAAAEGGRTG